MTTDIGIPYKVLRLNNGTKSIDIKFYLEDCITGMRDHLQDKSVDVVVTSPPYNIGVDYGNVGYNDNKPEREYIEWIERAGVEIMRVLKDDGSFFLNIGDELSNPGKAWAVAFALKKHFVLQNVIHWTKAISIKKSDVGATTAEKMILDDITPGHFKPIHSDRYLANIHEYIFHFTKPGSNVKLDKLAIGAKYEYKSNITRHNKSNPKKTDLKEIGNVWFIPYPTIRYKSERGDHPTIFPVKLPEMCIKLHGRRPDLLVLDPFCGTGTTAIACKKLGVNFIGFDRVEKYVNDAIERVRREDVHSYSSSDNNHMVTLDFLIASPGIQGAATEFPTRDGGEKE
jgi:site-specific DNA-methyltransferase (adenine-specific)